MEIRKNQKVSLGMMLVTIGIVYGDIGTSPLYVMKSIIAGNGGISEVSSELIIGSLSLVIWTITLLTTIKHVIIAMKANNHGEGGIFALYSLVKKYAKWLIIPAMVGGSTLLADGVLTPAVTVTTAIEGLRSIQAVNVFLGEGQTIVIIITLIIISALFIIQKAGTSKIGKIFGPAMLVWFGFLGIVGVLNIGLDLSVFKAFNPIYAIKILSSPCNKVGFMILGSVFLSSTGAEALYSDMGHVGENNIYATWPFVKACLILNYLGQGAWIISNISNSEIASIDAMNPFFLMLPEVVRPFAIVLSAVAAIIASQALISGSYTLVSEAIRLDLMPHLKIQYPSDTKGQIYIGTVNTILWVCCSIVVLYFKTSARMETAYGLSITITMLMVTLLLSVYAAKVMKNIVSAILILLVFGSIESVFFISSLSKFFLGGYITILIAAAILLIMIIWYKGTELENKYCTKLVLSDYVSNISELRSDTTLPAVADNLVYVENHPDNDYIDRDILYSILDKDPKRASAYFFINVNVTDDPDTKTYSVNTYGTDFIFRINLNLGYKIPQRLNIYLREIISDLLKSGEFPPQQRKFSIYGRSNVGSFKFCVIRKVVPSVSVLSSFDQFILNAKYAIRAKVGSKAIWYGLDTSSQIIETVPFTVQFVPDASKKLTRAQ